MILGRWPEDIAVICTYFAIGITLTVITALSLLLIFTKNNTSHEMVTKTGSNVLELETRCDYEHTVDETLNKLRRIRRRNNVNFFGFQHTSSFETEGNDNSDEDLPTLTEHKVFLVTTDDFSSSHKLCAVESAARIMSDYDLYVIIISLNNTDINIVPDKRFDELQNTYSKLKVFRIKGDRYFYDSPMRDILHESNFSLSLTVFAARVLTLWRYGGITYDLDLITLNNTCIRTYPIPEDANIMISRDGGAVMSAGNKCHPFLYNLMTSMTSLYGERRGPYDLCSKDVLRYGLRKFCYNGNKKTRLGTRPDRRYSKNCDGISAIPHSMICSEDRESTSKCIWSSNNAKNRHFLKNLCPVSYRQTPEEILRGHVIAIYENKYIFFH
ncbi:hypothetical protein B7P43_G02296 [Cryptotermes secundus]|uniref:Alpha-1,4-N-acetylglucosaminyltransferase n=2 Tax=Cryptotermes secundus TaxID=105785 RepID=A0A2J7RQH6_9NEOP|nr:hypothetical protein B7P43_G02296 [Cryptotermes secundus]